MGLVTVFAIEDCPFCKKAKSYLHENGIEYNEINLTHYPAKRKDMVVVAKSLTVPQVFFNDQHIGGATEVLAIPADEIKAMYEKVKQEGDPGNIAYFTRPSTDPVPPPRPSPRKEEIVKLDGQSLSFPLAVRFLERAMGEQAFSHSDLEEFLEKKGGNGKEVANRLCELGAVVPGPKANTLVLCHRAGPSKVLNNFRVWNDRVDDPMLVVKNLKKMAGKLLSKYRDDDGMVDYAAARDDELFALFDEASCEVQKIKLESMDPNTIQAFGINLYNLMISHAFVKVGAPTSSGERLSFFSNVSYDIGGLEYSLHVLENGILRGNKKGPPFYLRSPIPHGDPRSKAVLEKENLYLVHFALNCGAKSCPPIKSFTAEAVDEELAIVAQSFLEQASNCTIDTGTNTLTVSKILSWYSSDFGKNKDEVALTVLKYLSKERQSQLQSVIDSGKLKIKHFPYDWSSDAKTSVKYESSSCVIV